MIRVGGDQGQTVSNIEARLRLGFGDHSLPSRYRHFLVTLAGSIL